MPMLPIAPAQPVQGEPLDVGSEVPKEFAIYQKLPADFLPPGKTFNDLTQEERLTLQNQYRFSYFKPGMMQVISGYGGSF